MATGKGRQGLRSGARNKSGKWLGKKSRAGIRGFPVGTVAFYGPDNKTASKVAAGIVLTEDSGADTMERWHTDATDARTDTAILDQVVSFFRQHGVRSVSMTDRIIGCPHEEGIDYPEGETCPRCPFWAGRDRWAG